jgi:hypothetical protein
VQVGNWASKHTPLSVLSSAFGIASLWSDLYKTQNLPAAHIVLPHWQFAEAAVLPS